MMSSKQKTIYSVIILLFITIIAISVSVFIRYGNGGKKIAGIATTSISDETIKGIILPHHGIARHLIDESISRLSIKNHYSLIVILSPNHFFQEQFPIATTDKLEGASIQIELVSKLTKQFSQISIVPDVIKNEHGVTTFLPYIQRYFPNAQVLPLIFSRASNRSQIDALASFLAGNLSQDTLYLASIDFSHQSSVLEGLDKNAETINVLKHFDYHTLLELKDDHLDSPVAAAVLLMTMQKLNTSMWETWYTTHTGILQNDSRVRGTSYVIGIFHK